MERSKKALKNSMLLELTPRPRLEQGPRDLTGIQARQILI